MGNNRCYLDSNVLIAFFEELHQFHQSAVKIIVKAVTQKMTICVSPLVLDEMVHIILRDLNLNHVVAPEAKISRILKRVFRIPLMEIVNSPVKPVSLLRIPDYMKKFKLKCRDAFHLLTMKVNHVKYFASFDDDFETVFSTEILQKF